MPTGAEVLAYLEKHDMKHTLEQALQTVVIVQPDEPLVLLGQLLRGARPPPPPTSLIGNIPAYLEKHALKQKLEGALNAVIAQGLPGEPLVAMANLLAPSVDIFGGPWKLVNHNAAGPYPLSLNIQERSMGLDQQGAVQAEYIWLGGNHELRCKTRTLDASPSSVEDLPVWNFDGSSTEQAPGADSEVLLYPRAIFRDPFRAGPTGASANIIVVCDCYKPDPDAPGGVGPAIPTNTRVGCAKIMDAVKDHEPWFGIEQEYTLFEPDGVTPYGWPDCKNGIQYPPRPQGPYYCSIGTENAYGRPVVEAHYKACLYAGINISGINGEVMPGQWEYQARDVY